MLVASLTFAATAHTGPQSVSNLDALKSAGSPAKQLVHKSPVKKVAPLGERKTYTRSASYFYVMLGVTMGQTDSYATDIITGDNGEVYIKAPLSDDKMPSEVYMKGELNGDKITVKFPQDFATIGDADYTLNRLEYKVTNEAEQTGMYFIADKNEITYTVQQDGSIKMEESYVFSDEIDLPDFILGLTDANGNWVGYGDFNQVYTPFNDKITTMPADADVKKMLIRFDEYAAEVKDVGLKDGKVYLPGFNQYCPEACVVGDIDGNKLTFKTGQYVGVDDDFKSFAYFWTAKYEMGVDQFTGTERLQLTPKAEIDATWNASTSEFESEGVFVVNLGNEELSYISLFNDVCAAIYNPDVKPAAPMAPVFDVVTEYNPDEYYKYGTVRFLLPMIDVNGNLLDTSKMYYKFFIDGVPYEFKTSDYVELRQDMVEIPWDFADTDSYGGYDFKTHNITHIVYFYDPSMKMLDHMALQQYYKVDDTTVLPSEMTYYGKPSSVSIVDAEPTEATVEYYNLQGMRVSNPEEGVYLRVARYADGNVKTTKVTLP